MTTEAKRRNGLTTAVKRLQRENEELRRQVAEAEEALGAIREGRVDAIVVDGGGDTQIYSLSGAETVYRLTVETMREAALHVTPEGRILFCNQRFGDFVRMPVERVLGHNLAEFLPPEESEALHLLLGECLQQPVGKRMVFRGAGGTSTATLLSGHALGTGPKATLCLVAADLTELERSARQMDRLREDKRSLERNELELRAARLAALNLMEDAVLARERAEEISAALRESEERFRGTFENAAVGIAHQAPNGRWLRVNGKLCEITGYSREELLERTFADITHPDDLEGDLALAGQLVAGDIPSYWIEKRLIRKDGSIVWIALTVSLVRRPEGAPDHFIKVMRDIGLRKRAEEELNASRERFAGIVESAMDAIVSLDENQRIVLFNQAAEKMFRCPAAEAIGTSIERFLPERFRQTHHQHVERFASNGETNRAVGSLGRPIYGLRSNGEEFPIEASISRTLAGAEKLYTVILRDITARTEADRKLKESLRELRETQDILVRKERLATLGQLAGSVAHELRTPLNVITNSIYFLRSAIGETQGDVSESLDEMTRAVASSDLIISEMLDFVREPSRLTTNFRIGEAIEQALRLVSRPSSVQVVATGAGHEMKVHGNPDQITRILVNLIQNAYHAMPNGGELELTASEAKGEKVCVKVRDTGCGIAEEDLPKIFEPLYTTKTRGIGLGLAISHRYAQLNQGWLFAESKVGKGTTFRLILNGPVPAKHAKPSSKGE